MLLGDQRSNMGDMAERGRAWWQDPQKKEAHRQRMRGNTHGVGWQHKRGITSTASADSPD